MLHDASFKNDGRLKLMIVVRDTSRDYPLERSDKEMPHVFRHYACAYRAKL